MIPLTCHFSGVLDVTMAAEASCETANYAHTSAQCSTFLYQSFHFYSHQRLIIAAVKNSPTWPGTEMKKNEIYILKKKKHRNKSTSKQKHEAKKWGYAGTGGANMEWREPTLPISIMLWVAGSYLLLLLFLFFGACGNFVTTCIEYLQRGESKFSALFLEECRWKKVCLGSHFVPPPINKTGPMMPRAVVVHSRSSVYFPTFINVFFAENS